MARPKRKITEEEKKMFLSIKSDEITQELFDSLFADKLDNNTLNDKTPKIIPSKFNTYDEIDLKAGEYFNKENITTNCGLFIFNKFY